MIISPAPFFVAQKALVVYCGAAENASISSSYSFTSHPIGTASTDRYVIVAVQARDLFGGRVNSVTVAGTACTKVAEENQNIGHAQMWITNSAITTGTTATVAVGGSGTLVCCGINTYAATKLQSTTPTSTDHNATDASALSLTVSTGGFVVGCSCQASGATCTVTGATEDSDRQIRSSYLNGCAAHGTAASVTFDWTSSSNVRSCAASWR